MRLAEVEPRDVKRYAAEVAATGAARDTVRNALAPLRALFATAHEEGLIRGNPTAAVRLAQTVELDHGDDGERAKALCEEELGRLLGETADGWRLFVGFLARRACGRRRRWRSSGGTWTSAVAVCSSGGA